MQADSLQSESLGKPNKLILPPKSKPENKLWGKKEMPLIDIPHMHAKLLQSCSTLCDPIDYSQPGSSVHYIDEKILSNFLESQIWKHIKKDYTSWKMGFCGHFDSHKVIRVIYYVHQLKKKSQINNHLNSWRKSIWYSIPTQDKNS